jgi:ABC-2 type transport system ATP-binding protein
MAAPARRGRGELHYEYDARAERTGIPTLLRKLTDLGIAFKDLNTHQSSLEDIFVSLVHERAA